MGKRRARLLAHQSRDGLFPRCGEEGATPEGSQSLRRPGHGEQRRRVGRRLVPSQVLRRLTLLSPDGARKRQPPRGARGVVGRWAGGVSIRFRSGGVFDAAGISLRPVSEIWQAPARRRPPGCRRDAADATGDRQQEDVGPRSTVDSRFSISSCLGAGVHRGRRPQGQSLTRWSDGGSRVPTPMSSGGVRGPGPTPPNPPASLPALLLAARRPCWPGGLNPGRNAGSRALLLRGEVKTWVGSRSCSAEPRRSSRCT